MKSEPRLVKNTGLRVYFYFNIFKRQIISHIADTTFLYTYSLT